MLVLSRKLNERIRIDDDIIITLVRIAGGNVRLGFEAPPSCKVWREEVWQQIRESQPPNNDE